MPGMGGRMLVQELTERYSAIPVIWMSGHPREVEFPKELPGRERPFLMKPVPPNLLIDTVASALRDKVKA